MIETHRRPSEFATTCQDEGVALFIVVGLTAALTALSASFVAVVHGAVDRQRMARHETEARYLAEAGIETAVAALLKSPQDYVGEENVLLGPGSLSVRVADIRESSGFEIVSTGTVLDGQRGIIQHIVRVRAILDGNRIQIADRGVVPRWEPRGEEGST